MSYYKFLADKIKNKKILVLGLGKEGISSLRLLLKIGGYKSLAVADMKSCDEAYLLAAIYKDAPSEAPSDSIQSLGLYFGEGYQNKVNDFDLVFKSPGVVLEGSVDTSIISSQLQCFCEYYRDRIIGITGTKGKSTTAGLLQHCLSANGFKAVLAGNIGIPVFDIIDDIQPDTHIVIEMSCHQLEYMSVSPHIGILLNLHQEHLDHYGSYEKYCAAKYNIFKHMQGSDLLVASCQLKSLEIKTPDNIIYADYRANNTHTELSVTEDGFYYKDKYCQLPHDLPLIGIHNFYNIAALFPIIEALGIDITAYIRSVYSFQPLPHRLQHIGTYLGIDFYDDSISTMGDSTANALLSIKNAQTVLIGGMDRGIDYSDLQDFMLAHTEYVYILMEATGRRIYEEIADKVDIGAYPNIVLTDHLSSAVAIGFERTDLGRACILSPAAASYGIFRNFEHRGEVFAELVRKIGEA